MRLKGLKEIVQASGKEASPAYDEGWKKFLVPIDKTPAKEEPKLPVVQDEDISLDSLIKQTFKVYKKILEDTPLNPDEEGYVNNAKLVLSAGQAIMSTQLKVDENKLKARKVDDIKTILEELRDDQKKAALLNLSVSEEY